MGNAATSFMFQRRLRDRSSCLCRVFVASGELGCASDVLPEVLPKRCFCVGKDQATEKTVHYSNGEKEGGKNFKSMQSLLGYQNLCLKQTRPLCGVFLQKSREKERRGVFRGYRQRDMAAVWAGKACRPLRGLAHPNTPVRCWRA